MDKGCSKLYGQNVKFQYTKRHDKTSVVQRWTGLRFRASLLSVLWRGGCLKQWFLVKILLFLIEFQAFSIDLFMFGDYQTSILRNIFSPLSVFFPTSSLKQTPELCLYSPQNLISFTPSALPHAPVGINLINISHFLNKAHIVVC